MLTMAMELEAFLPIACAGSGVGKQNLGWLNGSLVALLLLMSCLDIGKSAVMFPLFWIVDTGLWL